MTTHNRLAVLASILALTAGLTAAASDEARRFWAGGIPFSGPVHMTGPTPGHYWLQLPDGFSADRKWPLILFFPGRGYGGKPEITNFLKPEFTQFRQRCRERGFVVCSVGGLANTWMNKRGRGITDACLKHVQTTLPIDERRVFAAGLSMGGGAALTYAKFRPTVIKAVCNFMGCTDFRRFYEAGHYHESLSRAFGGTPAEVPEVYAAQSAITKPAIYRPIPSITVHGDKDTCIPVWNATSFWETSYLRVSATRTKWSWGLRTGFWTCSIAPRHLYRSKPHSELRRCK